MSQIKLLAAATLVLFQLSSCVKDKKIEPVTPVVELDPAAVAFDFKATVNNKSLVPGSSWYSNAAGDSFTVSKFNYYITNIKFMRNDGYVFSEPSSYRINRHADGPCNFVVSGLPEGTYNYIEFLIGVDSVRNSSGAQTGALDVTQGMYWDWNTGYVFFKLEGDYKTTQSPVKSDYSLHVGTIENLRKCKFNLGVNTIAARKTKKSSVHFNVNIDEIFSTPSELNFDTFHAVSGGKQAGILSENYKDMFHLEHVEN